MQMRKKIKEERASMAVYVGVVLMSFLLLLTATYIGAINVRKTQLSTIIKIKESYEKDNGKAEEIYNSVSQSQPEPKPTYIKEGLVLHYDGSNNTGNGHSTTSTTWKDLSGNGNDGTLSASPGNTVFYWDDNNLTISGHSGKLQYYVDTPLNLNDQERTYIYTIDANKLEGSIWGETNISNQNGMFNYYTFIANRYGSATKYSYSFSKSGIYSYAVTLSSTQLKFYANGNLIQTTNNSSGLKCDNNLRLMAARYNNQNAKNLKMYQFLAYNRALTDEEIQHNYEIDKDKY